MELVHMRFNGKEKYHPNAIVTSIRNLKLEKTL
jgi:hypothetical protein